MKRIYSYHHVDRDKECAIMADIGKSMRKFLLQSVKAVNSAASSVASTTRYKVDELNLQNRRKELMNAASELAYTLWKRGDAMPEGLAEILEKVAQVDDNLSVMREERKQEAERAKAEKAARKAAKKEETVPVLEMPEEESAEDFEDAVEDAVDGIKEAVKETADAIEDAVDAVKGEDKE